MTIYIVLLLILLFLSIRYDLKNSQSFTRLYNRWLLFVFFFLICIAGFRNQIGVDTYQYELYYEDIPNISLFLTRDTALFSVGEQPLWYLMFSLFKTFNCPFYFVQFFIAIIFNCLLLRYLRNATDKVFMSLFCIVLYVWWNYSFEVLRESLCVALFLNGVSSLLNGNKKAFILWCIPAWFIHWFSIFITLLIYLALRQSYKVLVYGSIIFAIFVLFVGRTYLSQEFIILSFFTSDMMLDRMLEYSSVTNTSNINGIIYDIIIRTVAPIIVSYNLFKKDPDNKQASLLFLYFPFTVLMLCVPIFYRLVNYLAIIYVVSCINYLKNSNRKYNLAYVFVGILFSYSIINSAISFYRPSPLEKRSNVKYDCRYIPYTSIFEPTDPERDYLYKPYSK